ncbi:CUB and sushi domain-containing protein 3-like [Amphiura filiformis]|uniref:CUB and sushi domain-containing protein 3-like n=1 Tax=Amphiura filiformis TaxID=82378 RepID=UPI003B20CE29
MYPNNVHCTWIANGINAASIRVTFNDFFTEYEYDYLSIGQGNTVTDDSKMLYLSGKFPPNSVTSEGSEMWIEFASNDFAGRRGFQLLLQWMETVLPCSSDEFQCYSGFVCVDKLQVCDDYHQCIDGSDDFKSVCCGASDIHLDDDTTVMELQSYNFPNPYPNNIDCIWMVTALNEGFVMVQFLDFDTEIRFDYFSLGFGYSPGGHNDITEDSRLLYLSGPWSPISVTSDGPSLWIRFQSDVSKSGRGINLTLRKLQSQDVCQYLNITANVLTNITTSECSKTDCTWCINPLAEGVTILYMKYFNLDVTSDDMMTIGHGYNFTQENTLMHIDANEGPNSVVVEDTRMWIKVIRQDTRSRTLVKFQLGWSQELLPCLQDEFQCYNQHVCLQHSLACNKYPNCLDASDELESECCGSGNHFLNMINSTLTLTSYNYPNQYPRSTECTKFITSPLNGSVHVTFVAFETERQFDTLEIGYGTNPNDRRELLPLSGTIVPNSATFASPAMWMRFTSDGNEERSGYHLEIRWVHSSAPVDCSFGEFSCNTTHILICVDSGRVCDGVRTCPNLEDEQNCGVCGIRTIYVTPDKPPHAFLSPNYPQPYPSNLRCLWVIIAQDIPRIMVRIQTFSLERGYDFLTIGEGDYSSQSDSVIARLTGKIKLQVLVSSQDKMWMQMVTDSSGVDAGFQLRLENIENTTGICDQSQFACYGADRCVTDEAQCDGFDDCLNNADEIHCESIQCPGFYLCDRSQDITVVAKCVPYDVLCDGYRDCPIGDDEIECGKTSKP